MQCIPLGQSGLSIPPIVFGGNVFGWTLDKAQSFRMLDQLYEAGLRSIDTADVYSSWVDGNQGGESETIIGEWLHARPGYRDNIVLMTKVGADLGNDHGGLSEQWVSQALEDSLKRLQTDYIDLYQSHWPDEHTPHEETLGTYQRLLDAGKIRAIGASNYNLSQMEQAASAAKNHGLTAYQSLQPEFNLYDREGFAKPLQQWVQAHSVGVIPYFSLASGFLSGKYRNRADLEGQPRANRVEKYANEKGFKLIGQLIHMAQDYQAEPAEVALAWLIAHPAVTAPIASATKSSHINSLLKAMELTLSDSDWQQLDHMMD
ncbi:aldo/keto reductase [Celerinatantimonas yamalensis]|uniref:Aldo/keto reductase n=1 Tax=Celerinatantimonas yamalensis TaxID=559956 RepID=A0ABW9G6H4_9GAMM